MRRQSSLAFALIDGSSYFGNDFRQPCDTSFRDPIVHLSSAHRSASPLIFPPCSGLNIRIPVHACCTANIDDVPWLSVFDAEIRCRRPYQAKWRCVVQGDDSVPLLVCHLHIYLSAALLPILPTAIATKKTKSQKADKKLGRMPRTL